VNFEAHQAHALSKFGCRAEQPCCLRVVAVAGGQAGKAFENAGEGQVYPAIGCTCQRLMRVTFARCRLTFCHRDPRADQ